VVGDSCRDRGRADPPPKRRLLSVLPLYRAGVRGAGGRRLLFVQGASLGALVRVLSIALVAEQNVERSLPGR
jgi:hypothetical protein